MNIFIRWIGIVTLVVMASLPAMAQDHGLGMWHGEVATPTGTFALLFQLRSTAGTGLGGDVESVNQAPGEKMALANIVATPGTSIKCRSLLTAALSYSIPRRYSSI